MNAAWYLERGLLPIPMHPGRKEPAYKWKHMVDLKPPFGPQFNSPWVRDPRFGIGVLLKPSDLLVVDCDSEGAVAEAIGLASERCNNIVLSTHGCHMYYRRPEGCPPLRRVHVGACGKIDIMADGYMVAPPSVHPSGHRYVWLANGPLQLAPAWAVKLLSEVRERSIEHTCLNPEDVRHAFPNTEPELFAVQVALKAVNPKLYNILAGKEQTTDRSRDLWLLTNTFMRLRMRKGPGIPERLDDKSIAKLVWYGTLGSKPRERGWQWLCDDLARARLELGSS